MRNRLSGVAMQNRHREVTATASTLQILQSNSLSVAIQDELLNLILRGEFESGAKLSDAHLAVRFGVSRGPIREALRALEEAGLVRLSKNRGIFVKEFTLEEAHELYQVRIGLDEMVGKLLAPIITEAQIEELRALVDGLESLLEKGDFAEYFPRNIAFHGRVVEMVGNTTLIALYQRITTQMHLMRRQGIVAGGGHRMSNREHRAIVDALASKNPKKAARAMGAHGKAGLQRFLESLRAQPAERTALRQRASGQDS